MNRELPARRIARIVAVCLLVVLVAPVLAHLATLAVPGVGSYAVLSGSMEPGIRSGAVVYVVDTGDYQVGDAITYSQDGQTVTHRIAAVTDDGYRTRGDANRDPDDYEVHDRNIHGEVVASVPLYGRLFQTVAANRFLALAGLGVVLVGLGGSLLLGALDAPEET